MTKSSSGSASLGGRTLTAFRTDARSIEAGSEEAFCLRGMASKFSSQCSSDSNLTSSGL